MASILSLSSDIHLEIFKRLLHRRRLLALALSCKQLYQSFQRGHLGTMLECIRYNRIGCGDYALALLMSLRLMEPDIEVEQVRAFAISFHEKDWSGFAQSANALRKGLKSRSMADLEWYTRCSLCYYNRAEEHCILSACRSESRQRRNYRLVRLLANQCCVTRLRQGFGEGVDEHSEISTAGWSENQPPPTETEVERFERGVYALWIMANVASLIHRPDFLAKIGDDEDERLEIQQEIRGMVISSFDVWDWRAAMSIRDYVVARLIHVDKLFEEYKTDTWNDSFMWEDIWGAKNFHEEENEGEISMAVMAAFSPPGAMRFFLPDMVLPGDEGDGQRMSGELRRDIAALQQSVSLNGIPSPIHRETIHHATRDFNNSGAFFWSLLLWPVTDAERPARWLDLEAFYPTEQYPDRKKLPLEKPRAIVFGEVKILYGSKDCEDKNIDDGWAWRTGVHSCKCLWDDWRLMEHANYHKPRRRKVIKPESIKSMTRSGKLFKWHEKS